MGKKKILMSFGTRPEAIKMCPLAIALKKSPYFELIICQTGQHEEMLRSVMQVFGLESKYDLDIMKPGQTLFDITTRVLDRIKPVLEFEKPWLVLVHGDTTTTFASALASFYLGIPVGHVEAGLRTHDIYQPFPEEFNRQAVSIITRYYFCPTEEAKKNLENEGRFPESNMIVTGNTGIDALRYTINKNANTEIKKWLGNEKLILLTAHRRENLPVLKDMLIAIRRFLDASNGYKLIYPAHPNPIVQEDAHLAFDGCSKAKIIPPLDVVDFHNLISISNLVLTDSGGIQEEAPYFGVPVLVLRNVTERPEGVEAGTLRLVGNEPDSIYNSLVELTTHPDVYKSMSRATNPFGDGHACERIVSFLEKEALKS
jgi:UDP-N-acetylglucosamine 2-epimerase (non-hydrolysing)